MMNGYRVAGFHVYRGASREEDHALNQNVYAQATAAFLSALPVWDKVLFPEIRDSVRFGMLLSATATAEGRGFNIGS